MCHPARKEKGHQDLAVFRELTRCSVAEKIRSMAALVQHQSSPNQVRIYIHIISRVVSAIVTMVNSDFGVPAQILFPVHWF